MARDKINNKMYINSRMKFNAFTLVEIILATFIFSIIMSLVAMSLYSVQQTYVKVDKFNERIDQYQSIDRFCDTVIKNMVPFKWKNRDTLKVQQVFQGENDEMTFAYLHRVNNLKEGGLRFVRVFLENDEVKIQYRKYPILHWDENDTNIETETIAKNVRSLTFLYVDTKSGAQYDVEWEDSWDEESNENIPLAIQMKIEWNNNKSEVWLRRVAGSSRYSSYGVRQNSNSGQK